MNTPKTRDFLLRGACLLIIGLMVLYLWWPMAFSWWYITDDYRWPTIINSTERYGLREFIANINPPDWPLGSKVNRPSYYLSTSAFMLLFGANPESWHIVRIAILMLGTVVALGAAMRFLHPVTALTLAVGMLAHGLWEEPMTRLQSELFGFLGLSASFFFAVRLGEVANFPNARPTQLGYGLLLSVALCYTAGAKENFTPLIFGFSAVCVVLRLAFPTPITRSFSMPAVLALTFSSFLLACIAHGVLASGTDLYGNPVNRSDLLSLLIEGLLRNWVGLGAMLSMTLATFYFWEDQSHRRRAAWHLAVATTIVAYGGFLNWFYRGNIPPHSRYEFPIALLSLVSLGHVTYAFQKIWPTRARIHNAAGLVAAAMLAQHTVGAENILRNHATAVGYSYATKSFHGSLQLVIDAARTAPTKPILFVSHGYNDTEPLASVDLFLRAYHIQNPRYLEIRGYSLESASNQSERHLATITYGMLSSGRFQPHTTLVTNDVITINFSREALDNGALANFWPLPRQ